MQFFNVYKEVNVDYLDLSVCRKTMHNLSIKLEDYWNEIRYMQKKEDPKCTVPIEDTM